MTRLKWDLCQGVLGFVGVFISGSVYRADVGHYDLPCTSDGGCNTVAESPYSHITLGPIHDLPVALLGFITYIAITVLAILKVRLSEGNAARNIQLAIWAISLAGVGYSWYLQWIAHFVIGAFCVWCFASACDITLIFVVSSILIRHLSKDREMSINQ